MSKVFLSNETLTERNPTLVSHRACNPLTLLDNPLSSKPSCQRMNSKTGISFRMRISRSFFFNTVSTVIVKWQNFFMSFITLPILGHRYSKMHTSLRTDIPILKILRRFFRIHNTLLRVKTLQGLVMYLGASLGTMKNFL